MKETWENPIVKMANTRVRVESVLNDHFGMSVPMDADGWKARCPFYQEHDDGGIDRQFRIYSATNRGYCFAMHNVLDPVGLWRMRSYFPSLRHAAEDLLETYGIDFRPKPYQERMASLLTFETSFVADPDVITQVIMLYLQRLPFYEERQYEERLLLGVNSVLNEVHPLCESASSPQEVEKWLQKAKTTLQKMVSQS